MFFLKRCSWKFHKIPRKTPVPEACNFIKKETLAQVFSCEFCDISKNTFFTEHLRTTASDCRSSHSQMSFKIGVLKNFASFTGKHMRLSLFLIKLHKRLQHRYFPAKFSTFLRTPIFPEHLQ